MEKFVIVALSLIISALFFVSAQALEKPKYEKWAVYYGDALPAEDFMDYKVVVFDSQKHPPVRPLMNRGKILLGYLSIGEAENFRYDFDRIKKMGALLEENPAWPGHYIIDVRNKQWVKYLIEVKIPEILHNNFDGLMLDTADSPLYLWEKDKHKYAGMDVAIVDLLATIRKHYPSIKIMFNRGFHILPDVARYIDMFLAESIMVNSHTNSKKPEYFAESIVNEYVDTISKAQTINPNIKVYSLDYWPVSDVDEVKKIYKKQRERGYIPYVSTVDLMQQIGEPE